MKLDFNTFKKDLGDIIGRKSVDIQATCGAFNSHFKGKIIDISQNDYDNSINIQMESNYYNIKASQIEKGTPVNISGFKHPLYSIYGDGIRLCIQC